MTTQNEPKINSSVQDLLDQLNAKPKPKPNAGAYQMTFVTDYHKEELSRIPARHMVFAHVWNALPTDGTSVKRADVVERIYEEIGGIYHLCRDADRQTNGIDGAIAAAQTTLSHNKKYFQSGGSYSNSNGLPHGHWSCDSNGIEGCRQYIIKNSGGFDPTMMVELAADVRLNAELKREDDEAFKVFQEQQVKSPITPEAEGVTEPVEETETEVETEPVAATETEVETSLLKRAIYWIERKLIGCGVLKAETE